MAEGGDIRILPDPLQSPQEPPPSPNPNVTPCSPTPLWGSCRGVFALLGFLGFTNVYAMRVNLSLAIVAMVNHTAVDPPVPINATDVCPLPPHPGNHTEPPDVKKPRNGGL